MAAKYPDAPDKLVFNEALKRVLNALVDDLIAETERQASTASIATIEDIRNAPHRLAAFSPEMESLRLEAKQYLYANLYNCVELSYDHNEAARVIAELFAAWTRDPSLLPVSYASRVSEEGAPRVVADYIAGMTDNFILAQYATFKRSLTA
jgi:dGTPase